MNPEEKPITMPLRDWLMKRISLQKNIPYSTIEAIITHQFDSANQAVYLHKSLEIVGFGRFMFSDQKANKQLKGHENSLHHLNEHLKNPLLTDKEIAIIHHKIKGITKDLEELKIRINL